MRYLTSELLREGVSTFGHTNGRDVLGRTNRHGVFGIGPGNGAYGRFGRLAQAQEVDAHYRQVRGYVSPSTDLATVIAIRAALREMA